MQSQPCRAATAVSHSEGSPRTSPPANAADTVPAGSLVISAPSQQRARIDLLPNEVLLHIVDHLDWPSRRALGNADWHMRTVLTPLRRFDRLYASIRWTHSTERLAELLGSVAGEPAPQRGALLCSVVEALWRLGSASVSLSAQLIEQIETLPAAERGKPLVALAAALGRLYPREHELEQRTLALAGRLPPGIRGQVLGQCLNYLWLTTTQAHLQQWMAMVDALPPEGASRLLEAVVDVAAPRRLLSEGLVASVLEKVRALRTGDGVPASCQARVLQKLVDALDAVVDVRFGAKSRLGVWDATLDTTRAARGGGHWPLLVAVALHRWLGGRNVPSADRSPRIAQLKELYAVFKAEKLLAAAGGQTAPVMHPMWSVRQETSIDRCFAEAAGLDAATQATLYAQYSHLFVTMRGVEADDDFERERFLLGLQHINALKPASLRVGPLTKWGDALRLSEDAALWVRFTEAVNALPVEDRTTVLMQTCSSSHSRLGFEVLLEQTAALPPALGGPLLGKLAFRVMEEEDADEQQRRAQVLIALASKWPPLACTDFVVNAMSTAGFLKGEASRMLRQSATDIVQRLPLARRAEVLAAIATHSSLEAKGWVLEQLPALADDQQRLAVPGEPLQPYRAEIVRRMIRALGDTARPTEIQFRALWPSLREALDGSEAQARGSAVAALGGLLVELPAALREDVEQALATHRAGGRPAQPPLHAGAQGS